MTKNQPYEQLASQFIDMWQSQTQKMMSDPRFIQSMINMLEQNPTSFWDNMNNNMNSNAWDNSNEQNTTCTSAADAPNNGNDELAMVKRRLERCEARLQELESK